MKNPYLQLVSLLFLFLFVGCAVSDENQFLPPPQENNLVLEDDKLAAGIIVPKLDALVLKNVSYGKHIEQVFDIYLPEGRSVDRTKVIILIHGGGWRNGDKAGMLEDLIFFQNKHPDYAIVNLNYVLAVPEVTTAFPNQYLDIQAAILELTKNNEYYQIKPEFGLFGRSAGAHLAMMYDYVYDTTDQVKCIANIVGPSDLTDPYYVQNTSYQELLDILVDESQFPQNADLAALNSPSYVANENASPTLMFYGDEDVIVPISNAHTLHKSLREISNEYMFNIYQGGHGVDWTKGDVEDMRNQLSLYLDKYLALE